MSDERERIEDYDAEEQKIERVEKDDSDDDFEGHRMEKLEGKVEDKWVDRAQDV